MTNVKMKRLNISFDCVLHLHTGTSIFHAYAYYSLNMTTLKPYKGLLSIRTVPAADHIDVSRKISRCIFLYDSGRCEILRHVPGIHFVVSLITANSTTECVVVKELNGAEASFGPGGIQATTRLYDPQGCQ